MGILKWKIDSAEALKTIANESVKPWYKKGEYWFGIIANSIT